MTLPGGSDKVGHVPKQGAAAPAEDWKIRLEEDETKAKAQMESWQSVKDEKNASHKAFFEKRDQLSGRISLLDKECYRLKSV